DVTSSVDNGADRILTVTCDVSDSSSAAAAVDTVADEFGSIDVVVNNAGVGGVGRVGDVEDDAWHKVISVDLNGVFYIARAALPHLMKSQGSLVNTASVAGLFGGREMLAYDTAKGRAVNFTRATAIEYGHDRVRI